MFETQWTNDSILALLVLVIAVFSRCYVILVTLLPTLLSSLGNDTQAKKVGDARLTPTEVKRAEQLHYGWYIQAVSSLLGAMGKELYRKMDK